MNELADGALLYAAHGRPVLPVGADKRPLTRHGLRDATCDPDLIRERWQRWPNAGVALLAGPGWFAVDCDRRDALSALETEYGFLPDTRRVVTPRGGWHFYFVGDAQTGANVPVAGIDIRGEGKGYVVAPPTPGYELASDRPLQPAPAWFMKLLADHEAAKRDGGQLRLSSSFWAEVMLGVEKGARNVHMTSLAGHLLRRYVDPDLASGLVHLANQEWCRPPLPVGDVDRIIDSIAAKELHRRRASET
jgi:hypothetical protein